MTILGLASSLSTSILVTKHLGLEDRTMYGIATVTIMQVLMVAQLGLPGSFSIFGAHVMMKLKFSWLLRTLLLKMLIIAVILGIYTFFQRIELSVIILILTNSVVLIPAQWLYNSLQQHLKRDLFFLLRFTPSLLQFFIVLIISALNIQSLNTFLISWVLSNLIFLITSIIFFKAKTHKTVKISDLNSFKILIRNGYAGFIPHVSIQEILKLEYVLIPVLKSPIFSASYFAIIGIASFPKIICDSVAVSNFNILLKSDKTVKISLINRIIIQVILILMIAILVNLFLLFQITRVFPLQYQPNLWAIIPFTLFATFSSSRRMFLDILRASGEIASRKATSIEIIAFIPILVTNFFLLSEINLIQWSYLVALASLLGLLITFMKVKKYAIIL